MRHNNFKILSVGQTHARSLEGEGAEFTWCADWLELILTFDKPSQQEIQAIASGVFEIGLNVVENIPFVCFRVFQVDHSDNHQGSQRATLVLPWQECPFHLSQTNSASLPTLDEVRQDPEFRLSVATVLTDLQTANVSAFRYFTLSPFFSRSLVQALLQTFPYYTASSLPQAVEKVLDQFPINSIGDTARIRCQSGD